MPSVYDAIYLAPHLDDVALSCGGQIFEQGAAGRQLLIVTVMAGPPPAGALSPFAQFQHDKWGLSAEVVVNSRQAEDRAACQLLGAAYEHWSFSDCIYRRHDQTNEALYASEEAIFGPLHEAERELMAQIAAKMVGLPRSGRVFAPLAIGNHVDHQLTRQAAEMAFGQRLSYYEDYPYNQRLYPAGNLPPPPNLIPQLWPLSRPATQARLAAIAAFQSQLVSLFGNAQTMQHLVQQYLEQLGGERNWLFPISNS